MMVIKNTIMMISIDDDYNINVKNNEEITTKVIITDDNKEVTTIITSRR